MKQIVRSLPLFVILIATWLLLQGEWSAGNLAGGALVALGACLLSPVSGTVVARRPHPWAFVTYGNR